jgi:SdpC family antimicrobial peptide
MKNIRNFVIKYQVCTIMAISFLFFSCSKEDVFSNKEILNRDNNLKKVTSSKSAYSDEDVFKGIMFLEGKVANKLGDFKDLNFRAFITDNNQINEILKFQNEVIKNIKSSNPKYFSDFRAKIGSGDYYVVQTTIQNASNEISNSALILSNKNKAETSTIANNFANSFASKYNINEKSSKEDLLKAFQSMKSENTNAKMPDYYYKYAAVWFFAAAAAVIVIVLVAKQAAPVQGKEVSNYIIDEYQSEVTINLKGI